MKTLAIIFLTSVVFLSRLQDVWGDDFDLGNTYLGLGGGVVLNSSANLQIPITTVSGQTPPAGTQIITLPNKNLSPVNPVTFSADFHVGHWYQSYPWLGWRTSFNMYFNQKNITTYSYSQASALLSGCSLGNCYFKNASYSSKLYFMPALGLDLLSLRIPQKFLGPYFYPYLNYGMANALVPGESGINSFATGTDFSVGISVGIKSILTKILNYIDPSIPEDHSDDIARMYVEYQLQWFVIGLLPSSIYGGTPFSLSEIVVGFDIGRF